MLAQTFRTRIFTQQFPGIFTRGHSHLSQKLNSIQKNLVIRSLQDFYRAKNVFPWLHAAKFKVRFVGRGFSREVNALAAEHRVKKVPNLLGTCPSVQGERLA
jgi:hypothetical protein